MNSRSTFLSILIVLGTCSSSFAEALPKGAKDLTEKEVIELYSGNTMQWDDDNLAYFAPDGNVTSTFSFAGSKGYTVGQWKVTGSEICKNTSEWFDVTKKTSGKGSPDCWKWARKGDTLYSIWSVRFDGKKTEKKSWVKGDNAKIKTGDMATKRIDELKTKM